MNNKMQTISIVAVFMLITISIAPLISGTSTTNQSSLIGSSVNINDELSIIIKSCEYKDFALLDALGYTVYEVVYNIGVPAFFEGIPTITLETPFKTWEWDGKKIEWSWQPQGYEETHKIYVKDYDEKYLAGQYFTLSTNLGGTDTGFVKYWKDGNENYNITITQFNITDLPSNNWYLNEYIEVFDEETSQWYFINLIKDWLFDIENPFSGNPEETGAIPAFFTRSHRLGWLSEASYYLVKIAKWCTCILGNAAVTLGTITAMMINILTKIQELVDIDLVPDFINCISIILWDCYIMLDRLEVHQHWADLFKDNLGKAIIDFGDWWATEPYNDQIEITGSIFNCKDGEKVTISCRDTSIFAEETNIEGKQSYDFFVDSDRYPLEPLFFRNCQITVEGDKHTQELKSVGALSYVCAGGSLNCIFYFNKNKGYDGTIYGTDQSNTEGVNSQVPINNLQSTINSEQSSLSGSQSYSIVQQVVDGQSQVTGGLGYRSIR